MTNATNETFASRMLNIALLLQVDGGPLGTVPELLFEKKGLIPALYQLLSFTIK
jgi:hypothetical protein